MKFREMLKSKQEGFSLAELVVGMAIASIVTLGGYQVYDIYARHKLHTDRSETQKLLMNVLMKLGDRATRLVRWKAYDTDRSYFLSANNEEFGLTTWGIDDMPDIKTPEELEELSFSFKDSSANGIEGIFNDSFTMEMLNNKGRDEEVNFQEIDTSTGAMVNVTLNSVSGMLVSRCIAKGAIKNELTLEEVIDLPRAPFSYYDNGQFKVSCCPIGDDTSGGLCADGDLLKNDSDWRARTYHLKKIGPANNREISITAYPKSGDIRFIPSAGYSFYFDKTLNAKTYRYLVFTVLNKCQSFIDRGIPRDNCVERSLIKKEVITGFLESEFNESGIIRIDK